MVYSNLHTIDCIQALDRLSGMLPESCRGSGRYVMAYFTKMVMNQRLVKRLCTCAQPVDRAYVDARASAAGRFDVPADRLMMPRPGGCERCEGSGCKGRVLVPEIVFFPSAQASRHGMPLVLLGGKSLAGLFGVPGVEYWAR